MAGAIGEYGEHPFFGDYRNQKKNLIFGVSQIGNRQERYCERVGSGLRV
jgi:hypothetical protein